ncbi:MAG: protein kinase, partial [Myxococcales bacterium]
LEGESVGAVLARLGRLDVQSALAILLPVLDALEAGHRQGVVHRDLKPENIFLARVGPEVRVKILDFGIAKVMESDDVRGPRTNTGVVFGTPDYLSPEQARDDGILDGRSDIFSVGIVLFELVTGRRPFAASTPIATAYKIVHEEAPTLMAAGGPSDPVLQSVLDTALAKEREQRFSTAAAFVDMLGPLIPDGATRRDRLQGLLTMTPAPASPVVTNQEQETLTKAPPSEPRFPSSSRWAIPDSRALGALVSRVRGESGRALEAPITGSANSTMASITGAATSPRVRTERPPPLRPSERPPPLRPAEVRPPLPPSSTRPSLTPWPMGFRRGELQTPGPRRPSIPPPPMAPRESRSEPASAPRIAVARSRCHVRGLFARMVNLWVDRSFGRAARDEVLGLLAIEYAEQFRLDAFNALAWYDLDPLELYMQSALVAFPERDAMLWRDLAREHFDRDLSPIFRPSPRMTDPEILLRRAASGWKRVLDFGTHKIDNPIVTASFSRMTMRVEGFDAACASIRYAMVGATEGMLRSAGAQGVFVRVVAGESSFSRDFEYDAAWR